MLGSFNHGSLGAGLPVALGAAALDPKRQVWTLAGDGGFAMSMNDFVTAVRFDWPIKVIVFNNSEFGFVKMEMEVAGLPPFPDATGLVNPDFAAFAKACGGNLCTANYTLRLRYFRHSWHTGTSHFGHTCVTP